MGIGEKRDKKQEPRYKKRDTSERRDARAKINIA
jgi:hypothetical protein